MNKTGLILFAHGARSAGWAAPFERLRALTQARLPEVAVTLAFLELMSPRLPAAVAELVASGVGCIRIVPVFLGQGGHVLRDLPLMVTQLQLEYPGVRIDVAQAAGEDASVLQALADYCVASVAEE